MQDAVTISLSNYRKAGQVAEFLTARIHAGARQLPVIAELCRQFAVSEGVLMRTFKRRYGVTLHAFVIMQKMDRCRELLLNGNYSVKEVALQMGYSELCNFSRDFSRATGLSPTAYRRRVMQTANEIQQITFTL